MEDGGQGSRAAVWLQSVLPILESRRWRMEELGLMTHVTSH
jgi:hypothetical protein